MKMRRLFLIVATMTMLAVSMTACGGEDETTENTENSATTEQESFGIERGTVSGNSYENETLGLRCTLDDTWTIGTEEEILELNGLVEEVLDDEEIQEKLSTVQSFYDLYAYKTDGTLDNINLIVENLGLVNKLTLSEKEYGEAGVANLDTLGAEAGMENLAWEQSEIDFAGGKHYSTDMEYDMSGVHLCQKQVYVKTGDVMVIITFTSDDTAKLATMVEAFSAY